jgi:divalent metal cation (Fe/Co/Zn/Cd) transporter
MLRDEPQGMYAAYMAAQPATRRFPFGFARFEVLSGFANAIFLVFVGLSIVLESVERMYVCIRPLHAISFTLCLTEARPLGLAGLARGVGRPRTRQVEMESTLL